MLEQIEPKTVPEWSVAAYLGPRFSWDDLGEVLLLSALCCESRSWLPGPARSGWLGWVMIGLRSRGGRRRYAPEVGWRWRWPGANARRTGMRRKQRRRTADR